MMSEPRREGKTALLNRFAASFAKLDEDCTAAQWLGEQDRGCGEGRYVKPCVTDTAELDGLYLALPARFPELYEQLVLSYRWSTVDLRICRLLPNPVGDSLYALRAAMIGDRAMSDILLPAGFILFAHGPDISYDPVCFDTQATMNDREAYPIVRLDHEEILCGGTIRIVERMAKSFEHFIEIVLESA
jgi:hypothetical protein